MALMTLEEWKRSREAPSPRGVFGHVGRNTGPAIIKPKGTSVGGGVIGGGGGGSFSGAGAGGGGGVPPMSIAPFDPLTVTAKPSPEMAAATEAWKKRMADLEATKTAGDPNLDWQIEAYKKRMSADPTQRAIEKAASAIRSQAAGMGAAADVSGAMSGQGEGAGAAEIGESAQRALARSASDIALNREAQLDQLLLGGTGLMKAPGERETAYDELLGRTYAMNPYESTARLGLSQQELALQAYLGRLGAETDRMSAVSRAYGSPLDWYQMLLAGV